MNYYNKKSKKAQKINKFVLAVDVVTCLDFHANDLGLVDRVSLFFSIDCDFSMTIREDSPRLDDNI